MVWAGRGPCCSGGGSARGGWHGRVEVRVDGWPRSLAGLPAAVRMPSDTAGCCGFAWGSTRQG